MYIYFQCGTYIRGIDWDEESVKEKKSRVIVKNVLKPSESSDIYRVDANHLHVEFVCLFKFVL